VGEERSSLLKAKTTAANFVLSHPFLIKTLTGRNSGLKRNFFLNRRLTQAKLKCRFTGHEPLPLTDFHRTAIAIFGGRERGGGKILRGRKLAVRQN